jgi:hypothetical protein
MFKLILTSLRLVGVYVDIGLKVKCPWASVSTHVRNHDICRIRYNHCMLVELNTQEQNLRQICWPDLPWMGSQNHPLVSKFTHPEFFGNPARDHDDSWHTHAEPGNYCRKLKKGLLAWQSCLHCNMALTIIKLGTEKENFEPNMILQTRMTICKFLECECEKLWEWAITSNRSHIDPIMLEFLIQSLCFLILNLTWS